MNNVKSIRRARLAGIAFFLASFGGLCCLPAATFFYTFGTNEGGVASFTVTPDGQLTRHQTEPGTGLSKPRKLAVSDDQKRVLVVSEESPMGWIYRLDQPADPLGLLEFGEPTTEAKALGDHALVMADKGFFYWFDLTSGQIERKWNSRDGLTPPGHKGEDILFLPEKNLAMVSFQKDSKKGHKGSRLVLFDLTTFTPKADLQLPREYPSLNIPKSKKEQGPNPEMMFAAPKSNTLAVTLDLYGAIAFADLDAALNGEWKNLAYVPSSPDGKWGLSFPDRGTLLELGGKEYLLIANAAENGGLVLFDVEKRKIVQWFRAEAGAETPVYLPKAKKVVTVISGKMKQRTPDGLEKDTAPGKELLVLDVAPLESGGKATFERIPFPETVVKVEAIEPETSTVLLLVTGNNDLVTYDLAARKELAREPAKGPVNRMAVLRGK